jgi:hypothetical protein
MERIWEEVKSLTPEEQRRLHELLVDEALRLSEAEKEQEVSRYLLREGIISEIPKPDADATAYRRYTPVAIEGKPISETIIEERR